MLPCSAMSRAIVTRVGQLHGAGHRVDDPHVGLVRHEDVEVVGGDAGRGRAPAAATLAIANDAQRKTGLPCMIRCGIAGRSSAMTSRQSSSCRIRSNCSPSEPQTTGPMPGVVARADDRGAGAVGEDERGAAVVEVGDVGEPLDADHQHVLGAAAADHVGRPSARPWQKPAQAAEMSNAAAWSVPSSWAIAVAMAGVWSRWRDGRDDHAVDLLRRRCRRARAPCATAATDIICTVSSGVGEAALLDARSAAGSTRRWSRSPRRSRRWGRSATGR